MPAVTRAARAARAARQSPYGARPNTDLRDFLLRKLGGETGPHLTTSQLLKLCEEKPGVSIRINSDDFPDSQGNYFVDNVTLGVTAHSTEDKSSHVNLDVTMGFNHYAANDEYLSIGATGKFHKKTFQPVQLLSSHVGHGDHRSSYEVDPNEDYEKEKARVLQSAVEDFMMHFSHEMTQAEVKKDAQCLPQ